MSNSITIFSTLKPSLNEHIQIIQKNALTSWSKLQPLPEIILFNKQSELNVPEIPKEVKIISNVKRNEEGLPFVNDMFFQAQAIASNNVLLYVNGDILVTQSLITTLQIVKNHFHHFLVVGRRWDVNINSNINFANSLWYKSIEKIPDVKLHEPTAIDYLLFSKRYWFQIPPFTIGRAGWDTGMIYLAIKEKKPIIDATYNIRVIHQNHNYKHTQGEEKEIWLGKTAQHNYTLFGGMLNAKNILDAGWIIANNKIWKKNFLLQISHVPDHIIHNYRICKNQKSKMLFDETINCILGKGLLEHQNNTYLKHFGFIVKHIIENDQQLQINWLQEYNNLINYNDIDWRRKIVKNQIELYQPDIVFFYDPLIFDRYFILKLHFRPKLIVAWFGNYSIPKIDLTGFDLVLSNNNNNLKKALNYGAKSVESYYSGFPIGINHKLQNNEKKNCSRDIIIYEDWTQLNDMQKDIIMSIAKESIINKKYTFGFATVCEQEMLPQEVKKCYISHLTEEISLNFFRMAKICINFGFNSEIGAESIFDISGLSKFQLIEWNENVSFFFQPGKEIEFFYNKNDLMKKIDYFLLNPVIREEIAKSSHIRCLKDHSMSLRIKRLSQIINNSLINQAK
jgi:hypothetical protein